MVLRCGKLETRTYWNPKRGCIPRLGPKARQREAGENPFVVPPRGNRSTRGAATPPRSGINVTGRMGLAPLNVQN